jgi:hypothetical protein
MPPVDILKAVNSHPIDRAIPLSGQGRNYSAIFFSFLLYFSSIRDRDARKNDCLHPNGPKPCKNNCVSE